jgi:hypothetical protein
VGEGVSEIVHIAAEAIVPSAEGVLRALGRPPEAAPAPDERLYELLAAANALFAELVRPVGLWREVTREEFATVYRGEGENEPETPLEQIYPRADRLALFAVTVGEDVSTRIGELFQSGEYPLGAVLDAAASEGAERAADVVQGRWEAVLRAAGEVPAASTDAKGVPACYVRVLRYSPGYCGWNVSGQRALFRALGPEKVGITLNESCLMRPIKSVSGVMVAGAAEIHVFANEYVFCARCREWSCRSRLRELGA